MSADKAARTVPVIMTARSPVSGVAVGGDGSVYVSENRFQLNPNDLYPMHDAEHPGPGLFELPKIESTSGAGKLHVEVFPLRRHLNLPTWPILTSRSLGFMYFYYRSEVTTAPGHAAPDKPPGSFDQQPAPHS